MNIVRPDEKVGRNLPSFADFVDHFDRERAPARQNLGGARARTQELGKLGLAVPKLVNRILKHVDRIEALAGFDWPAPRLIALDKRDEHIELVPSLARS